MWKFSVETLSFSIKSFGSLGFNKSIAWVIFDLRKLIEFFAPTIVANLSKLLSLRGPVIPTWTGRVCLEINLVISLTFNDHCVII